MLIETQLEIFLLKKPIPEGVRLLLSQELRQYLQSMQHVLAVPKLGEEDMARINFLHDPSFTLRLSSGTAERTSAREKTTS